jgi:hypothetical protein
MNLQPEYMPIDDFPCSVCGKVSLTVTPVVVFAPMCADCVVRGMRQATLALESALDALEVLYANKKAK